MTIIDKPSTIARLEPAGLIDERGYFSYEPFTALVQAPIPIDSGRRTSIARELTAMVFERSSEGLLWIDEYGVWSSAENPFLFHALRASIGETRLLHEAPGHIFSKADASVLEAMLALILYFSWGAVCVCGPIEQALVIRISHDEILDVCCRTTDVVPWVVALLRQMHLEPRVAE